MSIKIKVCGITSVADGLQAAEAGADWIGLMFYEKSVRALSLVAASQIARALPASVERVGVFVNPTKDCVERAIEGCGLSWLQFHGDESPEFCLQFKLKCLKAFRIRDEDSLSTLSNYATDAFLLDAYSTAGLGGTGARFDWDLAVEAKKLGRPIFIAGGLTPENVAQAVRQVRPQGVDVSSGVEFSPGQKDPFKLRAFVAQARLAAIS